MTIPASTTGALPGCSPPWDAAAPVTKSLVTVVTPTYDRVELLHRCVASVMTQSYRPIQHIIVGDGCPALDEAGAGLLAVNPKLQIINLQRAKDMPDYGPGRIARVRNAGVRRAAGTLIAHLDDDNEWEPDHVETLVDALARRPDAAMAFSHRRLLIEGVRPYLAPCHPWSPDVETGQRVWQEYSRMGVYRGGSPIMRDRVSFSEERDITADTNELLVRREVHALFPFVVSFPDAMQALACGEDDVFCEQVYRSRWRMVSSGQPTLRFRIGGRFTSTALVAADVSAALSGDGGGQSSPPAR
jgi:Glycosyl transferase family 2